ncbi:hypothetical protein SAMN04488105_10223 [Salipiger thiooxidans]|uniref:Uncharacterized protein n=1 Tax=Salipiger thiooxidans TaxID=282683 RepID=A0A1G7B8G9_9RHOB|nr:hypothetical protein [Salipiger thiooxidans]SDE23418.1 hypothetical protein SAMN04488105_10223 [Salipiger thiooxidans]
MPTPHQPEPPKWLTEAAQVCQNTGVTITIEHQSRVYKIAPTAAERNGDEPDFVNWNRK